MPYNILMKRYNGSTWDELYPKTDWANISNKPLVQLEIISMVDTVAKDTLGGSFTWQINTLYFVRFHFGNSVGNITINGVGVYLGANPVNTTTFTLVANSTVLMYYDKTLNRLQITGSYRNFDASDGTEQDLSPIYFQLFKKANIDGYYQGLSVGRADNAKELIATSGVSDSDSYMLRTTAGSQSVSNGLRNDTAVKGKTYVLNQLAKEINTTNWAKVNPVNTFTVEDGVGIFYGGKQYSTVKTISPVEFINGKKYFLSIKLKLTTAIANDIRFRIGKDGYNQSVGINTTATTDWQTLTTIGTLNINTTIPAGQNNEIFISDFRGSDWDVIQFKEVQVIDLTKMYGLGNEPTTVAQFYKDFGSGFIPYNTGSFINAKPLYFKSNGLNQWSNDEYKRVVGGNTYKYLQAPTISTYTLKEYNKDKNEIKTSTITYNNTFTLANNTFFIKILDNGVATKQFLWLPWSDYGNLTINDWQPYIEHTREIMYFDESGDDFFSGGMESAGNVCDYKDYVNRKNYKMVGIRAYQSGDESDNTLTTDGTNTYYPLSSPNILNMPITETSTLEVDDHGIEWVENATGYLAPCKIDAVYLSQLKRSIENNLDKFNSFITALASYNGSQITSITWNSDFTICTINTV